MAIRYRKNINCLSSNELHNLREAYQAIYDLPEGSPDSFATLGGIHGLPAPTWCDHGSPGFLTWHRAYMVAFERALQAHGCKIMLPYWNWSSGPTTGVPAACREATYVNRAGDTVPNPLYAGPIASAAGGGTTARRPDIDTTTFGDLATSAQSAMTAATFASFQTSMNGPHGGVHVRTGGQMSSVAYAGFDPIFYLHHCNVDRLWWNWQNSHPGAAMPATEQTHQLDPFPRPFDDSWQTGSDVEDADDLGYRYLNWCFRIPPFRIWDLVAVQLPVALSRELRDARLVVRAQQMPHDSLEFRVLLGDRDDVASEPVAGNPALVGSIGLFGMGEMKMPAEGSDQRFDVALNVTDAVRRSCGGDHCCHDDADGGEHEHGTEHEHGAAQGPDSADGADGADDHQDHDPDHSDGPTREVALRIAAFDADGRPADAGHLHVDSIELEFD